MILLSSVGFLEEWPKIQEDVGYNPECIYNIDETGLFWKLFPKKLVVSMTASDAGKGYKIRKDRYTATLCCNMTGTHRAKLLIIGKAAKPRSFRNMSTALKSSFTYAANDTAWMTSVVFLNWFHRQLSPQLEFANPSAKKIIVFADNHSSRPATLVSQSGIVELRLFPANCTSKLQPLDQGIIATFKMLTRHRFVRKIIEALDSNESREHYSFVDAVKEYTFADAINDAVSTWELFQIINCWRKSGLKMVNTAPAGVVVDVTYSRESDDIPLVELNPIPIEDVMDMMKIMFDKTVTISANHAATLVRTICRAKQRIM